MLIRTHRSRLQDLD